MQRVLVTADLPSWDLQLRSDPPSSAELRARSDSTFLKPGSDQSEAQQQAVNSPPDRVPWALTATSTVSTRPVGHATRGT